MLLLEKTARLMGSDKGAELVEFAVSLPLLIVLVVAIYDFGTAFTLRHRLNSAAEEGGKLAARLHMAGLAPNTNGGCGAPAPICVVRDVVHSTLAASNVNDCGLGTTNGVPGPALTWTFTVNCPAPISLKIERGVVNLNAATLPPPFDSTLYTTESSRVSLIYTYNWQFNRAIQLIAPSANYLNSTITVQTTMLNID